MNTTAIPFAQANPMAATNATNAANPLAGMQVESDGPMLDQEGFLKLLVSELGQQDPFKAADSSKFIEQFTQMANYQAITDVSTNMQMVRLQQLYVLAQGLVGQDVEIGTGESTSITGTVQSASVIGYDVQIVVDGQEYWAGNIKSFRPVAPPPA